MANTDNAPDNQPSFEANLERLQSLVNELESGALSLDALIDRYETGMQLVASCRSRLASAELRVTEIAADLDDDSSVPF